MFVPYSLLFPGGGTWFNESGGYGEAATRLYQVALEYNDKGVLKSRPLGLGSFITHVCVVVDLLSDLGNVFGHASADVCGIERD